MVVGVEIRGFDGERKALVYDNYSKLIMATDTIRKVYNPFFYISVVFTYIEGSCLTGDIEDESQHGAPRAHDFDARPGDCAYRAGVGVACADDSGVAGCAELDGGSGGQ